MKYENIPGYAVYQKPGDHDFPYIIVLDGKIVAGVAATLTEAQKVIREDRVKRAGLSWMDTDSIYREPR